MNSETSSDRLRYPAYSQDIDRNGQDEFDYFSGNLRLIARQGMDGSLKCMSAQLASLSDSPNDGRGIESVYLSTDIQTGFQPLAHISIEDQDGVKYLNDPAYIHQTGYRENVYPVTRGAVGQVDYEITTLAPAETVAGKVIRHPFILYSVTLTNHSNGTANLLARFHLHGRVYHVQAGIDTWQEHPLQKTTVEDDLTHLRVELPNLVSVSFDADSATWDSQSNTFMRPLTLLPGASQTWTMRIQPSLPGQKTELGHVEWYDVCQKTARYWKDLLGIFHAPHYEQWVDLRFRSVLEAINCIRVNGLNQVVGLAESVDPQKECPAYSDALWVAMPLLDLQPDLYAELIRWYAETYTVIEGRINTQELVLPAVMAGLLFEKTAALDWLLPATHQRIEDLLNLSLAMRDEETGLFATDELHGYQPLLRHELATNVFCWKAFRSWAEQYQFRGDGEKTPQWHEHAEQTYNSIRQGFITGGSGKYGLHYAGLRFVTDYRLDPLHYYEYDGIDIVLLPFLGFCSEQHTPWLNSVRQMFSSFYDLVKSRDTTAVWWERTNHREYRKKYTDPHKLAQFSLPMNLKALDSLLLDFYQVVDIDGSVRRRHKCFAVARSGRLMGAVNWVINHQLIGVRYNAVSGQAVFAPKMNWRELFYESHFASTLPIRIQQMTGACKMLVYMQNLVAKEIQIGIRLTQLPAFKETRLFINGQPDDARLRTEDRGDFHLLQVDFPMSKSESIACLFDAHYAKRLSLDDIEVIEQRS